jgi:hypothetical protein
MTALQGRGMRHGDEFGMLGLGIAEAWAALVAISAGYHGWPENAANNVAEGGGNRRVEGYVGIVQNSKRKISRVTIGVSITRFTHL